MIEHTYNNPLFAEFYDAIVKKLELQDFELNFWKSCGEYFGSPILEMGCGTRRLLLQLAKTGYDITGIDISHQMLGILEKKIINCPPKIRQKVWLKEGNMIDPPITGEFRLILFAASQFLHLKNDDERLTCLNNCRRLLANDGAVIISNSNLTKSIMERSKEEKNRIIEDKLGDKWIFNPKSELQDDVFIDYFEFRSESKKLQKIFHWSLHPIEDIHMKKLIKQAGLQSISLPAYLYLHKRKNALIYICKKTL